MKEIENAINAGGCVGVIVNTVRRVDELYNAINEKITNAKILVDHSQFLILDRNEAEECIKQCVGKTSTEEDRKNTIVIGSQVLEQSLDIDFDLLVTDLCPIDLLMQRLGREQRHYRKRPEQLREAKCILLNCDEDKLEEGAKFIYGEYLLKRTLRRLPDHINLPDDISKLIGDVYDGKPEEDLKNALKKTTCI